MKVTKSTLTALVVLLMLAGEAAADTEYWLSGVPDYRWYYGCSPTSGGHLFGYWDNQSGYGNLYDGDAPMFAGFGYQPIDEIISSTEHINSTYQDEECVHDNSPPSGDTGPNSLGCFMHTDPSDGNSSGWNIATGLRCYADYDDPNTAIDESYDFHSIVHYSPRPTWPDWASFTFWDFQREIDAGRPVLLDCSLVGGGHSVIGYGYWADGAENYWFAVRDTWQDGNSSGTYGVVAQQDSGQEWWRWDLREAGDSFGNAYYVDHGILLHP